MNMQRRTLMLGVLGLALAAGILVWAFQPQAIGVETATATVGRFEVAISEDGRTRLSERYLVSAPLAGRLARITLKEGDPVQAGSVVAYLSPVLSPMLDERATRELTARMEAAQAGVERAQARVERAKVALEQVENGARRSEQLAQKGFIAPTQLDRDRLAVAATRRELDTAAAEKHVAGHDLDQAMAALGSARRSGGAGTAAFAIRSPISGRVLRVAQTSETTVGLGIPLLEIGDTRQMEVVADLLTTDALSAVPGTRVVIERWGGAGTLEGRISLIEPAAFTKVSALGVEEQRVRAHVALISPQEQWRPLGDGFRVGLRIITLSQPEALQVPTSAVFPLPPGPPSGTASDSAAPRHAVFRLVSGRAQLTPVELAARNSESAWIRSGLQAGQTVIIYPPQALRHDSRVVVRTP